MKRVYYLANARMPTEKAHGLQIVKMCEAFANAGSDVTLIVPKRKNEIRDDPFHYYGVQKNFNIVWVWSLDLIAGLGVIGFWLQQLTFSFSAFSYLRKQELDASIIFSRDILATWLISFRTKNVFYEMHRFPERMHGIWRSLLKRMKGIVSTNIWKAEQMEKLLGYPKEKILVKPNGFDPELFKDGFEKSSNKPIVMYTGHLYDWKGARTLALASKELPDIDFIFIGGTDADVERFKKEFGSQSNIFLKGHLPHHEIGKHILMADILALPNSAITHESVYSTSPIKLFEYMATGRPIIASDLPSIREIVSSDEVVFVAPDQPEALSKGIKMILNNYDLYMDRARLLKEKSKSFTWQQRVNDMILWMEKI